jgi:hypothetical protein
MGKTGTTTIQHFLMNYRPRLRERGYLFPTTFGRHNHETLSVYACGFGPGFARHKRPDLKTPVAFGDWAAQMEEGFREEIAATKPDHIVLSNEHIFEHVRGPERLQRLKGLLAVAGGDVKVIVYLRRPDSFMASFYAESVRMGYAGRIDDLIANPRTDRLLSYRETVGAWGDVFGDANVAIRLFEPKRLVNGDALADFGETIGLDLAALVGDKVPERRRDALDAYRTNFLRQFNAEVLALLKEGRFTNLTANDFKTVKVRGPVVRALSGGEPKERVRLTRKQATELIERHRDDNERLFERFGMEGFDSSEPPDAPPLEDLVDPNLAFELFARIWTSELDRASGRPAAQTAPPKIAARG